MARALVEADHEVCGHGYGWEEFHGSSREDERENIRRTVASLVQTTGQRPVGWFTRYACSPDTRELLAEEGGFLYDSLGLNDDLPYYVPVREALAGGALHVRGQRRALLAGRAHQRRRLHRVHASGLRLPLRGGAAVPRMMSIGLHCRIAGTPARSRAFVEFLDDVRRFPGVWFARRVDIARWWLAQRPPPPI